MNIGYDFRLGGAKNAGIGRYARELLFNILKIDTQNYYKVFYHPKFIDKHDKERLLEHPSVDLVEAPYLNYSFSEQIFFLKLLQSVKLNLVHFPHFNYPIFYKRPFVVTVHDLIHHRISGKDIKRRLKFEVYKKVVESAVMDSEKVITVSEFSKNDIVDYFKVNPNKIEVIYEGSSFSSKSVQSTDVVKKKYLIQKPYFIFVGRLEPRKNVPLLASIFSDFIEKHKLDMELVIVGRDDPYYPDQKQRAMSVAHSNKIVFTGFVPDSDLALLYQGAYAFVTLSMEEGFGLPGIESMNFGVPVLAPDLPIYNEIYDNAAIYFDPVNPKEDLMDKMRLLCFDEKFYDELRTKTHKRAEGFSWYASAMKTIQVYESTLK